MTIQDLRNETEKPVILADEQGLVTAVNDAFASAYGWTAESLVGRSIANIIPEDLRDAHNLGFSRFLST